MNLKLNLTPYTLNSPHSSKDKTLNYNTIKENIGENLHDLSLIEEFLDMKTRAWSINEKMDKSDFS